MPPEPMVTEEPSVRPVHQRDTPATAGGQLVGELEAVAARPNCCAASNFGWSVPEGPEESVSVAFALVASGEEAKMHGELSLRACDGVHEVLCDAAAEVLQSLRVFEVHVEQAKVPEEGTHTEGKEDQVLDRQRITRPDDVAKQAPHGRQVELDVEAGAAAEIREVRRFRRLPNVDGGRVEDPEAVPGTPDEVPRPVEVGVRPDAKHVEAPEKVFPS
mmetsp:Transcript_110171/g.310684  ORF Transcript_110171/g.310684 Transcript_110171/m.310684 type:complete len:217 (-) Transcript_110171:458-1108(-)